MDALRRSNGSAWMFSSIGRGVLMQAVSLPALIKFGYEVRV